MMLFEVLTTSAPWPPLEDSSVSSRIFSLAVTFTPSEVLAAIDEKLKGSTREALITMPWPPLPAMETFLNPPNPEV